MKLKRKTSNIRHTVRFPRVASGLATQSSRLLETVMERLATEYTVSSQDVSIRSGITLDDWSLRISMFNRLGTITITVDGVQSLFSRLTTDNDLAVVMDVQTKLMEAISSHSPTLKSATELVAGDVMYVAVDGESARTEYFSRISFPGKSDAHGDMSFKARMRHPQHDVTGTFEVAPLWTNKDDVVFSFDADTSQLADVEFNKRAVIVNELVSIALKSFDLEVEEATP